MRSPFVVSSIAATMLPRQLNTIDLISHRIEDEILSRFCKDFRQYSKTAQFSDFPYIYAFFV